MRLSSAFPIVIALMTAMLQPGPVSGSGEDPGESQPERSNCTATWREIAFEVEAGTWWSFATGAPHQDSFALTDGCRYDRATPSNTPLVLPPTESLPWTATAGGRLVLITNLSPEAGEVTLTTDVDAGSNVSISFHFEILRPPTPPPTPVPSMGLPAVTALGALAAAILLIRIRSPWAKSSPT
ncbi:MAG: hypothetical protein O3A47_01750 [Chloroflexi bacterium]|nr:hypothetical protein [Chloroflexota bacterium]